MSRAALPAASPAGSPADPAAASRTSSPVQAPAAAPAQRLGAPPEGVETVPRLVLNWFAEHARELPWREHSIDPWAVLVSEVMLQQTPVSRVLPYYREWLQRWPTPAALAASSSGEAVRAWGRLGYPRRALRLHAAAVAITHHHDGRVPDTAGELLALPGIGDYTANAVLAFAFGRAVPVVDTNVARVLARLCHGQPQATPARMTATARELLPEPARAPRWSVAVMELGALVCTARRADCDRCPLAEHCSWRRAGCPREDEGPRRGGAWQGTDRQCRGRILQRLREEAPDSPGVVLAQATVQWPDQEQARRCLSDLRNEGLVERHRGRWRLPTT